MHIARCHIRVIVCNGKTICRFSARVCAVSVLVYVHGITVFKPLNGVVPHLPCAVLNGRLVHFLCVVVVSVVQLKVPILGDVYGYAEVDVEILVLYVVGVSRTQFVRGFV